MRVLKGLGEALRTRRIGRMTATRGFVVLGSDGPSGAEARDIELLALVLGALMPGVAVLVWGAVHPGLAMTVALGLSSAAGGWVLSRIGLYGMRQEMVIDSHVGELREHRVTARGRVTVTRRVPLSRIESVYINRGREGAPSILMARLTNGTRLEMGVAASSSLERIHAQVVSAITGAPEPRSVERMGDKPRSKPRPSLLRGRRDKARQPIRGQQV